MVWAALKIQNSFRKEQAKRQVEIMREYREKVLRAGAAIKLQSMFRYRRAQRLFQQHMHELEETKIKKAVVIQKQMRQRKVRRVRRSQQLNGNSERSKRGRSLLNRSLIKFYSWRPIKVQ